MISNIMVEEALMEQHVDLMVMMREMRREMDVMNNKYEEKLKAIITENAFIRQDMGMREFIPSTPLNSR